MGEGVAYMGEGTTREGRQDLKGRVGVQSDQQDSGISANTSSKSRPRDS